MSEKTKVGTTTSAAKMSRFTLVWVPVIVLRGSGYGEGPVGVVTEPSGDTLATRTTGRQTRPNTCSQVARTTYGSGAAAFRGPPPIVRVGTAGFEPATSASRTLRATKLRYVPRPRL